MTANIVLVNTEILVNIKVFILQQNMKVSFCIDID